MFRGLILGVFREDSAADGYSAVCHMTRKNISWIRSSCLTGALGLKYILIPTWVFCLIVSKRIVAGIICCKPCHRESRDSPSRAVLRRGTFRETKETKLNPVDPTSLRA